MQPHFIVIGMSDSHQQFFPPAILDCIRNGKVFSGGRRHHAIVKDLLPKAAKWIDITVPLQRTLEQYAGYPEIIVFASGDPLFFGFATTLQREYPESQLTVWPSFHSLQMLAHRFCMPYHDMHMVSLTGRPWHLFDVALIQGEEFIGILTDKHHTPQTIAARMLEYGYDNYTMWVGECLGNETDERLSHLSLPEAAAHTDWRHPNCLLLRKTHAKPRRFGLPEAEFHLLNGRAKMITKMPIRLLTLSMLELDSKTSFWDVGFCTGSVSIEAKLQFPHLTIHAFEIRNEGRELMDINSRRFSAPGIESHIGDFLTEQLDDIPKPDAVFIGGHGGRLHEVINRIDQYLQPNGTIVINAVTPESISNFEDAISCVGRTIVERHQITIDEHHPILILKAK